VPGASTILEREVLRGQRRWQTFAFRGGFAAAMFVVFAVGYRDLTRWNDWSQPNQLAYVGQQLFEGAMYAQWWLLGLLTPVLVAQGIVEEKNQGTLDLLAISRLTPEQLLRGKVLSSLSHVGLLLLAGMPLVALCLAFGGISPLSIVIAYAATATAVVSIASLAAFFALFARGPLGPLVLSWGVAFAAWLILPLPGLFSADDDDAFGWSSLAYAFFEGLDHPSLLMLWPCVVWLVISALVLRLASQVFSALIASEHGEDEEAALLSIEVWGIERLRKRQGLRTAMLMLTSPLLAFCVALNQPGWLLIFSFVWSLVALYTGLITILLVCRTVLLKAAGFRGKRRLNKAEKAAVAQGPRARGVRPAGSRQVWGNPVAWREVVTRAHGVLATLAGKGYIAALLGLLAFVALAPRYGVDPQFFFFLSLCGFVGSAALAVLVATSSMVGEQRQGTLALLCVTPMGGAGILGGKLLATVVYVGPLFAMSTISWLKASQWFGSRVDYGSSGVPDTSLMVLRTLSTIWIAFAATFFLVAASLWLAARMRTPTRAWLATLGMAAVLAVGPGFALALARGRGVTARVVAYINPILQEDFFRAAMPDGIWVSGLGWFTLAVLLLWHNARTLPRTAR